MGKEPKVADRMLHTYGLDGMLGLLSVNEVDEALHLGISQVIPQHLNQRKTNNTLSVTCNLGGNSTFNRSLTWQLMTDPCFWNS